MGTRPKFSVCPRPHEAKFRAKLLTQNADGTRQRFAHLDDAASFLGVPFGPVMLSAAFVVLAAAVVLGTTLAIILLRDRSAPAAPWPLRTLHGILGIGGLSCLVLSLRGPPRGVDQGVASFGAISAVLIALAALAGVGILFMHVVKKRRAGSLIGLHATLAVAGFVVLAAYLLA
jgi:hypothetical protein